MTLEALAVVATIFIGCLPFWNATRRRWLTPLLVLLGASGLLIAFTVQNRTTDEQTVLRRPAEVSDRGYVTSKSCRSCHPAEYHSWHKSFHRTMTQVASHEAVVGNFDTELELDGREYRLFERDDKYWVAISPADGEGDPTEHEVVMTTGSHFMQFYWYELGKDRELGKLPFVYLFSESRWVNADSTFLRPPSMYEQDVHGQWNSNCINCHSTGAQPRREIDVAAGVITHTDTQVAEFGIACEACHGPGETHVKKYQQVLSRYSALASLDDEHQISHPDDIKPGTQSQICGQCHGISLPASVETMHEVFWDGFDYRPGDDLMDEDSDRILVQKQLKHPMIDESLRRDPGYLKSYFWADGMVRVSGREYNGLVMSPCHTHQDESRGVMQCMSCHELHPDGDDAYLDEWADDQLRQGMEGNDACLQCHDELRSDDALAAHTFHPIGSTGSECYNCHMPHTTYGLFKGIRSHTVSSPSVTESSLLQRPNACNLCHLDKTLDWTAEHLEERYGMASPPLTTEQRSLAASTLWSIQGDAGLRAIVAWHMGWGPALETSGADWMPPFLGLLMTDDYDAVRYIAYHSLLANEKFKDYQFDYLNKEQITSAQEDVVATWDAAAQPANPQVMIDSAGSFNYGKMLRLLSGRDNRDVLLNE